MRTPSSWSLARIFAACLVLALAVPAAAAGFPERLLTIVVPFAAGSAPDVLVRALASAVAKETSVQVIVDNKPGASSMLAAQSVARAAPDGYTFLITGNVALTGNPHVLKKLSYDPVADFTPVNTIAKGSMYLYVNRERIKATTAPEFIDLVAKNPGKFSFAYTSITSRLPVEVLKKAAGLDMVGVPYRAGHAALPDLLGGQVDMLVTDASAMTHVKSGKLAAIGVTDGVRSPFAPDVPTFEESGIRGMRIGFWLGAYLPAKAPPDLVRQLGDLLQKAAQTTAVRDAYLKSGTVPFFLPAGRLGAFQAEETAQWGQIIRDAGIQPE